MGEKPQQIEITISPGAGEELARFITRMLERHATASVPPSPDAEPEPVYDPEALGMSEYTLDEGVAYVDERGYLRDVPPSRVTEVPANWRKVWLGVPEGTLRP